MSERSGIDMIEELLMEVKTLRKEVSIMEILLKKTINIVQQNKSITQLPKPTGKIEPFSKGDIKKSKKNFKFTPAKKQAKPNGCMCSGKMVISDGSTQIPIPNVNVKVFDDKDNEVKATKTNRAGKWMAKLPVGRYVVEFTGKFKGSQLYPINKNIEVKNGMTELDVQ